MNASLIQTLAAATLIVSFIAFAGCDDRGAGDNGADSTSRLERGIDRVGEKIETAAADVETAVNESRLQMIVDNIKGMDSVQVEITDDGAVTLIGSVASTDVRADAERLVLSIEGVDNVRNSIAVAGATHASGDSTIVRERDRPNVDSAAKRR